MKGVASYDDYLGRDTDSGRFFHPKKVSPLFLPRNHPQSENLERYHINRIKFNLIVSIATAIHWNLHKYTNFYIFFFSKLLFTTCFPPRFNSWFYSHLSVAESKTNFRALAAAGEREGGTETSRKECDVFLLFGKQLTKKKRPVFHFIFAPHQRQRHCELFTWKCWHVHPKQALGRKLHETGERRDWTLLTPCPRLSVQCWCWNQLKVNWIKIKIFWFT